MKLRPLVALAALLTAAGSLTACGTASSGTVSASCKPAHKFTTATKGTLTVASYDLPPFSKVDGTKLTGVDADILNKIAKRECLTVSLMSVATAAVIPTVQSGRADVGAGDWYRTAERAKIVSLSDPLYLDQMAIISKDGADQVSALKGKKVGTVDGYLWDSDLKTYLGGNLKVYSSGLNMYQDLKAGRIQYATDSYGSASYNEKDFKIEVVKPDPAVAATEEASQSAFPVSKKNASLLTAMNADITAMHKDGEIAKILESHGLKASAADTGTPRLVQ